MVIADPKLADFSAYADVDILTPNLAELQLAVDAQLDDLESIAAAASGYRRIASHWRGNGHLECPRDHTGECRGRNHS